jgi:hypothetical protein
MPHLIGPAGAPLPPTRNELKLREEVDRLHAQLDAARQVIEAVRRTDYIGAHRAVDAYDQLTKETP